MATRTTPFTATYRGKEVPGIFGADFVPDEQYCIRLIKADNMLAWASVVSAECDDMPTIMYLVREEFLLDWDSELLQRVRVQLQEQAASQHGYVELPGPYFRIEQLTPFPGHWEPLTGYWLHEAVCTFGQPNLYLREQLIPATFPSQRLHYWVREDAERIVEFCQQKTAYAQFRILEHQP
jgi:hypothetical protein